jgi:hypothetical protein
MPIHYPFYLMLIDYDNKQIKNSNENKKLLEKIKDNKKNNNIL